MSSSSKFFGNSRICGIIVTYRPEASVVENIRQLTEQVSEVLVIDNSPGSVEDHIFREVERLPGVRVIRNYKNLGIGAALNIGIKCALKKSYDWIATFDQDSTIAENFFQTMLSAYDNCPFQTRVALISPVHCASILKKNNPRDSEIFRLIQDAWTSGSLIRASIFSEVGFFDEVLFIDYVDFDFCLRLGKKGYKLIRSCQSYLAHHLGTAETHVFFGITLTIKTHRPWRHYYMMRNRLWMIRRYAGSFPFWGIKELRWIPLDLLKIIFFETDKRAKISYMCKGFHHGITGRMEQPFGAA